MPNSDLQISDMSQTNFTLVFDGPALKDHTIDVRDLAPALLAVGELFDTANQVLNEGLNRPGFAGGSNS